MKTWQFFTLIFFWCFAVNLPAQQNYSTRKGDIALSFTEHDSIRLMVSNQLSVTLDYETSKVTFSVPYETFRTQIDSIDNKLKAMKGFALEFTGKLGITINTKNTNAQKYNMEGLLTSTTPPLAIKGNGTMTCIPAGDHITPACTLLINLETGLAALQLNTIFPEAKDGVRIDVRQSLLEKEDQ